MNPKKELLWSPWVGAYPLIYPKYTLLRTIRALLRGTWGVLE